MCSDEYTFSETSKVLENANLIKKYHGQKNLIDQNLSRAT